MYLQNRNKVTDIENKFRDAKVGNEGGMILCIKQITNENLLSSTGNSAWCSVVTGWIYVFV